MGRTADELRDLQARLRLRVTHLEKTAAPENLRAVLGDHEGRFRTLYETLKKARERLAELKAGSAPRPAEKPSGDAPSDSAALSLPKLLGAATSGFLSSGPIGAAARSALTIGGWWLRRRFARRGRPQRGEG